MLQFILKNKKGKQDKEVLPKVTIRKSENNHDLILHIPRTNTKSLLKKPYVTVVLKGFFQYEPNKNPHEGKIRINGEVLSVQTLLAKAYEEKRATITKAHPKQVA